MDEYSSRRAAGGLVISRRSSSLVLRDSSESPRDRNVQVCSRVGCSSKLNPVKPSQVGSPSKSRTSKAPFRPPGLAKEVIGSSSKAAAAARTSRKPMSDVKRKSRSHIEIDSENSSVQEESEGISESSGKAQMRVHPDPEDNESAEHSSAGARSGSGPTNRLEKRNTQRFGLEGRDSPTGSSGSFAFKRTTQGTRNNGATTSRCNLKTLRCNSISDVVASGCSSSTEPTMGKSMDIGRKRVGESESSLPARGKKMSGPMMDDKRSGSSSHGISISDSRRTRNLSPAGDSEITSVRTRRSTARTRLANQENRSRLPLLESPLLTPSSSRPDISLDSTAFSSDNQFSAQNPSSHASSFRRPGSGGDHRRPNRSSGPYEFGISRSFMNRDNLRPYNLDGIAEMLLALERIEQEEEPTYEQLLVLETNLFLGGLAFHDQHRDMRLDIDNMSYEELLALEERIGTVSTGVPEEDLRKCLRRTTYHGITDCGENEDDVKCSICQEEYADGEDVGRLRCDHRYHAECIHQWLRLKNWCPICKASAVPPPSSPSPLLS
uniref:RING-type E3 ubiquitin transferase n=2 Tax=Opuntia streptacantha TaxID=393608 RepID=A0A7C9AZD5_OPUST